MPDAIVDGIKERIGVAIKVNQSVGIQVPENRHNDLLEAIFNSMQSNTSSFWTFVTINNTYDYLNKTFKEVVNQPNITFIDCVSRAAGIGRPQGDCIYIESPTMLEKVELEIVHSFTKIKDDTERYVVIDSLSSLMIYNEPEIIREFVSLLMNRTRAENIHIISIIVEEELDANKLIQLNDKIVVLRDSFIE